VVNFFAHNDQDDASSLEDGSQDEEAKEMVLEDISEGADKQPDPQNSNAENSQ
jgi:hypothetical protein